MAVPFGCADYFSDYATACYAWRLAVQIRGESVEANYLALRVA